MSDPLEYQSDLNIIRMCEGNIDSMTSRQRMRFLNLGVIRRVRGPRSKFQGTRYVFTERGKEYLRDALYTQ